LNENAPRKDNNFGTLRLFFASVVILSHSAEILDGDRSRELLAAAASVSWTVIEKPALSADRARDA
jgi:hypothetical protein